MLAWRPPVRDRLNLLPDDATGDGRRSTGGPGASDDPRVSGRRRVGPDRLVPRLRRRDLGGIRPARRLRTRGPGQPRLACRASPRRRWRLARLSLAGSVLRPLPYETPLSAHRLARALLRRTLPACAGQPLRCAARRAFWPACAAPSSGGPARRRHRAPRDGHGPSEGRCPLRDGPGGPGLLRQTRPRHASSGVTPSRSPSLAPAGPAGLGARRAGPQRRERKSR